MSDAPDLDSLAAEHALGCLEGDDLRHAEYLITQDPAFARAVTVWRERLAPLAAIIPPAPPPATLWDRIAASTTPASTNTASPPPAASNVVPLRRLRRWQVGSLGTMAIAASLAAFIVLRPTPPAPEVAVLAQMAGGTPVLVATTNAAGHLTIRPNGAIGVPSDRDLELWALAKGDTKPRSLGVLPAGGRDLVAKLAPDTQLLVSLEPRGGSPTGQPTGPVLFGGTLMRVY